MQAFGPEHPDHAQQVAAATERSLAANASLGVLLGALAELVENNPTVVTAISQQLASWLVSLAVAALRQGAANAQAKA